MLKLSDAMEKENAVSIAQTNLEGLLPSANRALKLAVNYSLENAGPDGHWYGELR